MTTEQLRTPRRLSLRRIPSLVRNLAHESNRIRDEKNTWSSRYGQWVREYRQDPTLRKETDVLREGLVARGLGYHAAEVVAEERVHLERFCELKLAIPKAGLSKAQLQEMGFVFPNVDQERFLSQGSVWMTKFPDGWSLAPSKPDRLDTTGSREATVYDQASDEQMTIFWSDSVTNTKFACWTAVKPAERDQAN